MSFSKKFRVQAPNVTYSDDFITAEYDYQRTVVQRDGDQVIATPESTKYTFRTGAKVPRVGAMIIGLGGNNGTTLYAGIVANREGISWQTKSGVQTPNYFGSLTQSSTVRLGADERGDDFWVPLNSLVPMVHPNDLVLGGWDINGANLAEAMQRAQVLDYDLQRQLVPLLQDVVPLPSIYDPSFIAANQKDRANNLLTGTKQQNLDKIRADIRDFKAKHHLDKVIVLWSANTERYAEISEGLNDTADNLLSSIRQNVSEVSPSTIFAVASVLEGCTYINGSPQNTFVPGLIELAERHRVFIAGDDFKTGQTKMKSVMVDWLIGAGLKPTAIVSYNHLGNNDGKNLSAPSQFRSKEISKSSVVDDMIASNPILYDEDEAPDHCVVIKYVPYVGDSKRALDEYTSQIFLGGHNTIVMHNTCEDSLLATPIIIDLIVLAELCERIEWKTADMSEFEHFHPVLSLLSYLLKAPLVPRSTPVVNALFRQRACIENLLKACVGLPAENSMLLEHKAKRL